MRTSLYSLLLALALSACTHAALGHGLAASEGAAALTSVQNSNSAEADGGALVHDAQALARARSLVESVRAASYPELRDTDIRVRLFRSRSDYFRTRFDPRRFALGRRMRYYVEVNPEVFELNAPEEALRAIVAHELGHVLDFTRGGRVRLLGLVRLLSKGYTARFERRTDLEAVARGCADGLIAYRRWLYSHVPAGSLKEKRRDYLSPEEIEAVERIRKARPGALAYWLKHVPLSLEEIERQK